MLWGVFMVSTYIYLVVSRCSVVAGSCQTAHTSSWSQLIKMSSNCFNNGIWTKDISLSICRAPYLSGQVVCHILFISIIRKAASCCAQTTENTTSEDDLSKDWLSLSSLIKDVVVHLLRSIKAIPNILGTASLAGSSLLPLRTECKQYCSSFGWWAKSGRMNESNRTI